ncbi:VOC family protein [Mycetocola saprophilus]|uniref:VOC family protein n=1 Tax=Mycetocola saprophilus TaxID=76636 RepID=UPI0004C234DE|nr:VOC family protein [Mycetocola saprophilus]
MSGFHHVEIWIADRAALTDWAWLLSRLGFTQDSVWDEGESWGAGGAYLSLTTSPNMSSSIHDRRRAGINHLAFRGGSRADVDALVAAAPAHGWRPLYAERYPYAGGTDHYACWLENSAGFKTEVVAE